MKGTRTVKRTTILVSGQHLQGAPNKPMIRDSVDNSNEDAMDAKFTSSEVTASLKKSKTIGSTQSRVKGPIEVKSIPRVNNKTLTNTLSINGHNPKLSSSTNLLSNIPMAGLNQDSIGQHSVPDSTLRGGFPGGIPHSDSGS